MGHSDLGFVWINHHISLGQNPKSQGLSMCKNADLFWIYCLYSSLLTGSYVGQSVLSFRQGSLALDATG